MIALFLGGGMWAGCRIWKSVVGNEESEECQYSLPLRLVNRDVYSVNSKNLELIDDFFRLFPSSSDI
jgi:hypothetical protein